MLNWLLLIIKNIVQNLDYIYFVYFLLLESSLQEVYKNSDLPVLQSYDGLNGVNTWCNLWIHSLQLVGNKNNNNNNFPMVRIQHSNANTNA